ncbi:hypothetical protein C8J56DRAFT_1112046, partial [Mycena floridula]
YCRTYKFLTDERVRSVNTHFNHLCHCTYLYLLVRMVSKSTAKVSHYRTSYHSSGSRDQVVSHYKTTHQPPFDSGIPFRIPPYPQSDGTSSTRSSLTPEPRQKRASAPAKKSSHSQAKTAIIGNAILSSPLKRKGTGRSNMKLDDRRQHLETDPWIYPSSVYPSKVGCRGCDHWITLDTRGECKFYTYLWKKHRDEFCRTIKAANADGLDPLPLPADFVLDESMLKVYPRARTIAAQGPKAKPKKTTKRNQPRRASQAVVQEIAPTIIQETAPVIVQDNAPVIDDDALLVADIMLGFASQ